MANHHLIQWELVPRRVSHNVAILAGSSSPFCSAWLFDTKSQATPLSLSYLSHVFRFFFLAFWPSGFDKKPAGYFCPPGSIAQLDPFTGELIYVSPMACTRLGIVWPGDFLIEGGKWSVKPWYEYIVYCWCFQVLNRHFKWSCARKALTEAVTYFDTESATRLTCMLTWLNSASFLGISFSMFSASLLVDIVWHFPMIWHK